MRRKFFGSGVAAALVTSVLFVGANALPAGATTYQTTGAYTPNVPASNYGAFNSSVSTTLQNGDVMTVTASGDGATIYADNSETLASRGGTAPMFAPNVSLSGNALAIGVTCQNDSGFFSECAGQAGKRVPTVGTFTFTFDHPVLNPVFSFGGIGGNYQAAIWSDYTLTTPGMTASLLASNGNLAVTGNTIHTVNTTSQINCSTGVIAACGSVQVTGYGTSFTFTAGYNSDPALRSNSTNFGNVDIVDVSVSLNSLDSVFYSAGSESFTTPIAPSTPGADGSSVTLPNPGPSSVGDVFAGWICDSTPAVATTTINAGGTTCVAQWTPLTYTLTYDAGTGSNAPAAVTGITAGTPVTLDNGAHLTPPAHFTFAGWSCGDGVVSSVTVNANVTCTATYNAILYTLTYDAGTGSNAPAAVTGITAGTDETLNDGSGVVAPAGFAFKGWDCGTSVVVSSDVTCHATYAVILVPLQYVANFPTNSGVGVGPVPSKWKPGSHVHVSAGTSLSVPGYTFLGWATTPGSHSAAYPVGKANMSTIGAKGLKLYGVWAPITNLGTVYYFLNEFGTNFGQYQHAINHAAEEIVLGKYHTITISASADLRGAPAWNHLLGHLRIVAAEMALTKALNRLGDHSVVFRLVNENVSRRFPDYLLNRHAIFTGYPGR